MKLTKTDSPNGGMYIVCHIGKYAYTSYWSAPPESCDHAGLHYLKDRYRCITTEKRSAKFKELFKKLMRDELEDKK